jgi:hypothetical protein
MQYPDFRYAPFQHFAAPTPVEVPGPVRYFALPQDVQQGPFYAYATPAPPVAMYPTSHVAPTPMPQYQHLPQQHMQQQHMPQPPYVLMPQMQPMAPHPHFQQHPQVMQMTPQAMMPAPLPYQPQLQQHQLQPAQHQQPTPSVNNRTQHHHQQQQQGLTTRKRPAHPTMVWGVCGTWPEGPSTDAPYTTAPARRHVSIPASAIEQTRGSEGYAAGKATCFLPICDARHRGVCTKAAECPLIHVEPTYLQTAVTSRSTCCSDCGDVFTRRTLSDVPVLRHIMFEALSAPPGVESLAATDDIQKHTQGPLFNIPISQLAITTAIQRGEATICEDHFVDVAGLGANSINGGASGCPRGKDCPKFHVCRRVMAALRGRLPAGYVPLLRIAPAPEGSAATSTEPAQS